MNRWSDWWEQSTRDLSPLPSPVDLVVLTLDEFERARHENDPLVREALAGGFDLLTA